MKDAVVAVTRPGKRPKPCEHRRLVKRDGKTYCGRCKRQIYL